MEITQPDQYSHLYKSIFEQASEGIAYCEMLFDETGDAVDYRFLSINQAFYQHTPFPPGLVEGKTVVELIPSFRHDPANWLGKYHQVLKQEEPSEFENYVEGLDRWFWVRVVPIDPTHFVAYFKDISKLKTSQHKYELKERELNELNKEYSKILNSMSDGVIFQNERGEVEYFNERALEILHLTEDQLMGKTNFSPEWNTIREDWSYYPPEEHPVAVSLKTGESLENQIMGIATGSDSYRWLSINSTAITNQSGKVTGVIAVFRDISEIREQSEFIKESEESNAFLYQHSSDVICLLDEHGIFQKISESSEEVLGYSPESLLGSNIDKNIYEKDAESIYSFFTQLSSRRMEGRFAYRYHHATAGVVWLETVFKPILNSSGDIKQVIATIRNIDHSKLLENELIKLNEELNRSNQELTDFAYVASHDLQEPLRMISSFGNLLKREYGDLLDENGHKYLDFTLSGAHRMKRLIDDLLKYSRVNTTDQGMELVDIQNIVDTVIAPYKEVPGVIITSSVASISVEVIPSLIERVIQNLLENAIKFKKQDETGQINIATKLIEGFLELSIADNGIGINPVFHNKIFKIFQRLHNTSEYPGTGIGLSIVKRIVERHGGHIEVESEEGTGSTFFVRLPLTS